MDIHSDKMTRLLIESVHEYLDKSNSKESYTRKALSAMLEHFKNIKMTEFYSKEFPKELFELHFDELSITLYTKLGYLALNFMRSFKFTDDSDETIEIRFYLHFQDIVDTSWYENSIEFSNEDSEPSEKDIENEVKKITQTDFFRQIENRMPTKYELKINYNV